MHIKRVEIQGFKTFADRTVLDLTSGITAVVGPNGSGKSNIADAISWVLGEQNVRNLRGSKALDVIFAGSEKRKPTGMAEVSITLDNTCGSLPLNYTEVTVTRRIFRSGDSEYFINKTACRLKDIYELFLDTGMGREAYSMVSQGEIDAILSAKSEDRRALFEEAAGIKKYRFRRKEASRKLENTETNLRRVNDIVSELSGQIEPLEEQASQASRYNELVTRLRQIETGLLINDLRRWTGEMDRVRQTKAESTATVAEQDKRIDDLEWEKEKLSDQLTELDRQVDTARGKHQEAVAIAQRVKSQLALVAERQRSAEETRQRLDTEIQQLEKRLEEATERYHRLESELSGCAERESGLAKDVESRSKAMEEASSELESVARIIEDRKSAYLELAREQATKRAELESLRVRQAELEVAVEKYVRELSVLEANLAETNKKKSEVAARAEELRTKERARAEELPPLKVKRDQAQAKIQSQTEKLTDINRATVGKSSRLSTLKEMADAHEGFFDGVRAVMAGRKAGMLHGDYAVVADVISVPKGLEVAIEVALGSSVQDIISDTVEDSKEAIRFLKENRAGRATFLPLDGVRETVLPSVDNRLHGVQGIASDLINYDGKYTPAIDVLLGRVIVVDNIDNAVQVSRKTSGWGRIVTLEGEVIVPTGAMTGGARQSKGPNLLGRKQEMDTLTEELDSLDSARKKAETELDSAKVWLSDTNRNIEELEKAASTDKFALVEAERQVEFLGQEQRRLEKQIEVVMIEEEDAQKALTEDNAALDALDTELSAAGKENIDLDELVAGAQKKLEELSTRKGSLSEELMEMSVTLASVRERRAGIAQSLHQTKASIEEMHTERAKRLDEIKREHTDAQTNVKDRDTLAAEVVTSEESLLVSEKQLNELVAQRTQLAQTTASADAELKTLNRARAENAELLRNCDVKEARLEIQITQTSERLMDEYEILAEDALAQEEPAEVERGTATEVGQLRREIKNMGPVNTGAIQEYERIRERWDFLMTQKTDLDAARIKLVDAIQDIDKGTQELFMTTFRAIQENFDKMFKRLFHGGRTELILTDPNNLLETGVEVIVQPPGKKLQNLVLLSGGERALTASALLFALLMSRPSPFVMFDEVDAPLDDSNVERFADVLHEFAMDTQFIIVTHNRATMEAADTLYGVTMSEPGISKLISVRLADESERDATGSEIVIAEPVSS